MVELTNSPPVAHGTLSTEANHSQHNRHFFYKNQNRSHALKVIRKINTSCCLVDLLSKYWLACPIRKKVGNCITWTKWRKHAKVSCWTPKEDGGSWVLLSKACIMSVFWPIFVPNIKGLLSSDLRDLLCPLTLDDSTKNGTKSVGIKEDLSSVILLRTSLRLVLVAHNAP